MTHTAFISVNRFSFQMQGFSRLCVCLILYAKLTMSKMSVVQSDIILFVFLKDVLLCDCGLLFLVTKA